MKTLKNALISIVLIGIILVGASRLFNFELPSIGSSSNSTSTPAPITSVDEKDTTLKAGTFVFENETTSEKTTSQPVIEAFINFTSNGQEFFKIKFWKQGNKILVYYQSKTQQSDGQYQIQVSTGSTWSNDAYKTIVVADDAELSAEFYDILMDIGHYQSNSEM